MMLRCDTLVADALWETIHAEVQDFVQNTLATMLRTTFRKKKDLSRLVHIYVCVEVKLYRMGNKWKCFFIMNAWLIILPNFLGS